MLSWLDLPLPCREEFKDLTCCLCFLSVLDITVVLYSPSTTQLELQVSTPSRSYLAHPYLNQTMFSPYGYLFQVNPAKPRISEDILTELESYFAALLFKYSSHFQSLSLSRAPVTSVVIYLFNSKLVAFFHISNKILLISSRYRSS